MGASLSAFSTRLNRVNEKMEPCSLRPLPKISCLQSEPERVAAGFYLVPSQAGRSSVLKRTATYDGKHPQNYIASLKIRRRGGYSARDSHGRNTRMSILSARFRYGLPLVLSAGVSCVVACSGTNDDGGTPAPVAGSTSVSGSNGSGVAGSSAGTAGVSGSGTVAGSSSGGSGGTAGASNAGTGPGGSSSGSGTVAGSGGAAAGSGGASGGASGAASSGAGGTIAGAAGAPTGGSGGGESGGAFKLTSPDLEDGAKFGKMFTCAGYNGQLMKGDAPELNWSGVPEGTKSFAITFLDQTLIEKNQPQFGNHWAIWNIPWDSSTGKVSQFPKATTTLSGDLASAKQSGAYFAPCSQTQNQEDEYVFTIYALSTATLSISGSSVANARSALESASAPVLATAKLRGHAGYKGE